MKYGLKIDKNARFESLDIYLDHPQIKYISLDFQYNYNKEFKIKQFDIIIGNPPYNASGTKASGNTIWQLFVNNSIKLLKPNGYICFVHPNGWRKPNTEKGKFYGLFEKMTKEESKLQFSLTLFL